MTGVDIEDIEMELVVEAIFQRYGYDFRDYSKASLKRRLLQRMKQSNLNCLAEIIPKVLYDEDFFDKLLKDMSITVTHMFRDPPFFNAFREKVLPLLKTYPFIKLWHAGCATGEEVYSTAIILMEEGFYDRSQIYATDYNLVSLEKAKEGIYPLKNVPEYTKNYNKTGGKGAFSDYYYAKYDAIKMNESLKKNITFTHHNLVSDGVFSEMNLIICRNVLIYFNKKLQNHVFKLFQDSICHRGFLCLGMKETLNFSEVKESFETFLSDFKIFRKGHPTKKKTGSFPLNESS